MYFIFLFYDDVWAFYPRPKFFGFDMWFDILRLNGHLFMLYSSKKCITTILFILILFYYNMRNEPNKYKKVPRCKYIIHNMLNNIRLTKITEKK